MSWWSLVRADLSRHPMRMSLTAASLVLAFVLFGLLQPIRMLFAAGIDADNDARLVVVPRHSVADMLPVAHGQRIAALDNIATVAHMTWFGGTYQDPANFFPQYAVTPDEFLRINAEISLSTQAAERFRSTRHGAIAGAELANRFGWRVGDIITLVPNIWHNQDGSPWRFELAGIYSTSSSLIGDDGFYFSYEYFDEYRAFGRGTVGAFVLQVENPLELTQTISRIDDIFANSSSETRTQSSRQYSLNLARQLGDVGLMATLVLAAVLFTLVMITGHTLAVSVRERVTELAVCRVLGFPATSLALLVLTESVVLTAVCAVAGLAIAHGLALQLNTVMPQIQQLGGLAMTPAVVLQGLALACAIGAGVTFFPATTAVRQNIVTALRAEA